MLCLWTFIFFLMFVPTSSLAFIMSSATGCQLGQDSYHSSIRRDHGSIQIFHLLDHQVFSFCNCLVDCKSYWPTGWYRTGHGTARVFDSSNCGWDGSPSYSCLSWSICIDSKVEPSVLPEVHDSSSNGKLQSLFSSNIINMWVDRIHCSPTHWFRWHLHLQAVLQQSQFRLIVQYPLGKSRMELQDFAYPLELLLTWTAPPFTSFVQQYGLHIKMVLYPLPLITFCL